MFLKKTKNQNDWKYEQVIIKEKFQHLRLKFYNKTASIISIFMCATLMSIFSFFLTRFGYKSSILKYKNMFDYYERQGITGQAAIDRIELEERSRRRDRAISLSGSRSRS